MVVAERTSRPPMVTLSKFDYFLQHRPAACDGYSNIHQHQAFSDGNELLHELRTVFDWIAEEKGVDRVTLRKFNERLQEIHRVFPLLSKSFAQMDSNNDCWLEYSEFVEFCLQDKRLDKQLRRSTRITVYGLDANGRRTYKDTVDPDVMCEMSVPPPILPWEVCHVVEWKIANYEPDSHAKIVGPRVQPGFSMASIPFRAAGVCGYLRFWPVSFYTATQRRKRAAVLPVVDDCCTGRSFDPPDARSWCCLGACFDDNVHLHIRFFVADQRSEVRTYFWTRGINSHQVWSPPSPYVPSEGPLLVGIEIHRNLRMQNGRPEVRSHNAQERNNVRPNLNQPAKPSTSVLLGCKPALPPISASASVASLPSLHAGFSTHVNWRHGEKYSINC